MLTPETARQWYPEPDPVHGFDHVLRVYSLAVRLAGEEGADMEIVKAAALLHDAQGSATVGGDAGRAGHHHSSADFARKVLSGEGWVTDRIESVLHCIRAHRFRDRSEPPQTLEAKILFDADKLDVLGAVGAVRAIAYSVIGNQPVYFEPSEKFLSTGKKEAGELHSSYHEWLFKLSKIKDMLYTTTARTLAEDRHRFLAEFFERLQQEFHGDR